ncbi:unnamed protein product [marine sediment metagenome]|uniref:Uncharacterized protein n=1 Tax=marine sediment metagenome TaxID=412755 RepID=X1JTU0_9ZZZZ
MDDELDVSEVGNPNGDTVITSLRQNSRSEATAYYPSFLKQGYDIVPFIRAHLITLNKKGGKLSFKGLVTI